MLNDSLYSSENMNWETPSYIFDQLNDEFNFTLDVCATPTNAKVPVYFTPVDDGLSKNWSGVCWMNPPYGREISKWVEKAYNSSLSGCTVVCLLPCRTDTKWWHNYVMKSSEIRLMNRRLSFVGSTNKAPFPTAIVVFDPLFNGSPILSSMAV